MDPVLNCKGEAVLDDEGAAVMAQRFEAVTENVTRCETYDTSANPTGKEGQVTEFSW